MNAENDAAGEGKDKHDSKPVNVAPKISEECYRRMFETAQYGMLIINANTLEGGTLAAYERKSIPKLFREVIL